MVVKQRNTYEKEGVECVKRILDEVNAAAIGIARFRLWCFTASTAAAAAAITTVPAGCDAGSILAIARPCIGPTDYDGTRSLALAPQHPGGGARRRVALAEQGFGIEGFDLGCVVRPMKVSHR